MNSPTNVYAAIHCGDRSEADLVIVDKEKELTLPTLSNPNVLLFHVQNSLLWHNSLFDTEKNYFLEEITKNNRE